MLKYPLLFSPITLAGTTFRNRIFASPISGRNFDAADRPDENCVAFYARKAQGGAASVCVGDCIVDVEHGLFGRPMLSLEDRSPLMTRALNRLSHGVTRYGAVISAELQHAGLYANASRMAGNTVYGPTDGATADGLEYREMPESRINEIIGKFAQAAAYAKQCGFGMVTIHGGHGWLLSQFMSPNVNNRRDQWGGTPENRMRFPIAVIDAVRRAVGRNFPIEIRISGSEVTPRGYGIEEGVAIAKALDGKVDLIHVSAGHHEHAEVFCVTHPSIFAEDSANIAYAAEIKRHVKTPVATVGAHGNAELMEEILASGKADVIEIARGLLADPDLPDKLRAGRDDEVRPCLRCMQCFSGLLSGGTIYCAVNPEIGNEIEYRSEVIPLRRKTVLIAGGGVAGMQAAITCAKRGHEVVLAEASDKLGGTLICEENVSFKRKIKQYLSYQQREIEKLPIDVQLNTHVKPEYAATVKPDVILAATGASSAIINIPGIENTVAAEDVYAKPELAENRVAILGGGLVGQELAIYLAQLGRDVTVIEMAPALNSGGNILHQLALNTELASLNVRILTNTRALEIADGCVQCATAGEAFSVEADVIVRALGQSPRRADAEALREYAPEFRVIGDCVSPGNIMSATSAADAIARSI